MPKSPRVDTKKMTNQQKLDFLIDLSCNGGPSTLYNASLQELIDDVPRRVVQSKVIRDGKEINLDQEVADTKSIVIRMEKTLNAQTAVIAQLASKVTGSDITVDQIANIIREAVQEELGDLEATAVVTLTNKDN